MSEKNVALVVGNGESRRHINLNQFKKEYEIFGCNAIYRDFDVDHLICCDRRMVDEALQKTNEQYFPVYTRKKYYENYSRIEKRLKRYNRVRLLPDLPFIGNLKQDQPDHWGSGPYALLLASLMDFHQIDIIGFDLYGLKNYVNNIYKDTKNYSRSNSFNVEPSFWIYQIKNIIKHFPHINYNFFSYNNWTIPDSWKKENVKFSNIEILKQKSLTINISVV